MLVVHQLNIKIQKLGGMSPMKKYINIVGAFGLIVLLMAMPFLYTVIYCLYCFLLRLQSKPVRPDDSSLFHLL